MTHEQVKASLARITRSSYGTSALLEHSANSNNKCTCCTNIHQTQLVYRMSKNLKSLILVSKEIPQKLFQINSGLQTPKEF